MKKYMLIALMVIGIFFTIYKNNLLRVNDIQSNRFFAFQAIDTMKTSRDMARIKLNDPTYSKYMEAEVIAIKKTGATHIAIATPYDREFLPFLKKYVEIARKNDLHVWFRGNLSGWEGWFDYSRLTPQEHTAGIISFLRQNKDLFESGDYFSSCPECENREKPATWVYSDVEGYRSFLVTEYNAVKEYFRSENLDVKSNLFSMNYDIAKAVMDKKTAASLDGLVVIDHYTAQADQLAEDIVALAQQADAKVLLGEFGAPIPDIHGTMSADEQAKWLDKTLARLIYVKELEGVSYWTATGGSTAIFVDDTLESKPAVTVLKSYFSPKQLKLKLKNQLGAQLSSFRVTYFGKAYQSQGQTLSLPSPHNDTQIFIEKDGYYALNLDLKAGSSEKNAVLVAKNPPFWERYLEIFKNVFGL